jgi:RNA-binding protein
MTLTPTERRDLRARAHHLHPVVMIGDAGLTPAVLREIEQNLKSHELIKIRATGDRAERDALLDRICGELSAAAVQHIGKVLVVYRPKPPEEKSAKPTRRMRKPARKTKRSYQMEK